MKPKIHIHVHKTSLPYSTVGQLKIVHSETSFLYDLVQYYPPIHKQTHLLVYTAGVYQSNAITSCLNRASHISVTLPVLLVQKGHVMWQRSLRSAISNTTPTFKGQCLMWLRLTCLLPVLQLLPPWQYWSNCHRRSGGARPRILPSLSKLPSRLLPVISLSKPSGLATLQPHAYCSNTAVSYHTVNIRTLELSFFAVNVEVDSSYKHQFKGRLYSIISPM